MYGGNQGREPSDDNTPEPSIFKQLLTGLAILFGLLIAGSITGYLT